MSKKKNTSHHNQNRKNHRNGIKKLDKYRKISLRGVDVKLLKNTFYAKKYMGIGRARYEELYGHQE